MIDSQIITQGGTIFFIVEPFFFAGTIEFPQQQKKFQNNLTDYTCGPVLDPK